MQGNVKKMYLKVAFNEIRSKRWRSDKAA